MNALKKQLTRLRWQDGITLGVLYYVALLPWQPVRPPLTLGLMVAGLFWLLRGEFQQKLERLRGNGPAGVLFLFWGITVLAAFYSPDKSAASTVVFRQLPLIAWPLLLGTWTDGGSTWLAKVLRWLVGAVAVVLLLALLRAAFCYLAFPHLQLFFFDYLADGGRVPPHYLALFTNFSYGLVLLSLLRNPPPSGRKRLFRGALLLFFFVMLILLSVRSQFVLFLAINAWLVGSYCWQRWGAWRTSLSLGGMLLVFFGLALLLPGSRQRLDDTYAELRALRHPTAKTQTNPRVYIWQQAWKAIRENPWQGYGTGAEDAPLQQGLSTVEAQFWNGSASYTLGDRAYNYHNAYLQRWAGQGLLGLLSLLLVFLVPVFWPGVGPWRSVQVLFLLCCGVSFATESMLQRQAGLLFFSFLYALLFVYPPAYRKPPAAEKEH
ncbi:MAG: O-antigen ligase family protein [Schleiferiaceae bacterium]|nr:O-antigen ligase family protein [Schleiferiaceae bacterium]